MKVGRPILKIELTEEERNELERNIKSPKVSKRDSLRSEIILLRSSGMKQRGVADKLGVSNKCVAKWTSRFKEKRLAGLKDKSGRGVKPSIPEKKLEEILVKLSQKPPEGRTRWSSRLMAKVVGVSTTVVRNVWKKNDIKPHRIRTFKISKDPNFETKFWDVIGLYLNPPYNALVFCSDEKSQCQALERSQPGLPLGTGHIRTKTHDYIRHGTTTLFAALEYGTGKIIHRNEKHHTNVEWLRFLKQIDRETPKNLDLHLIMDNYCTHKHQRVKEWLKKHPRIKVHFIPTSSSWMNMIERFFADITQDVIRDGSFTSVRQLEKSIKEYIDCRNNDPKPYVWKADGKKILEKIERAKKAMGGN